MKVYSYDPVYRAYVGEEDADESPLEEGVYLIPAGATELAPPSFKENEIPVFDGSAWKVVPDYRGKKYYDKDGAEKIIHDVDVVPDPSWTVEPPVIPPVPAETEQQIINRESLGYLAQTDWYVIRQMDNGTPVPEEIRSKRQVARDSIVIE